MIEEEIDNTKSELQRADHLLYVTLKYTRTVDVIRNTIKRLISAFDYAILAILEKLKDKKKLKNIPMSPIMRVELMEKLIKDKNIRDYVNFYFLLKKIDRASYKAKEEYRKNVTLITHDFNVNVEMLKRFFAKTKEFGEFSMEFTK